MLDGLGAGEDEPVGAAGEQVGGVAGGVGGVWFCCVALEDGHASAEGSEGFGDFFGGEFGGAADD